MWLPEKRVGAAFRHADTRISALHWQRRASALPSVLWTLSRSGNRTAGRCQSRKPHAPCSLPLKDRCVASSSRECRDRGGRGDLRAEPTHTGCSRLSGFLPDTPVTLRLRGESSKTAGTPASCRPSTGPLRPLPVSPTAHPLRTRRCGKSMSVGMNPELCPRPAVKRWPYYLPSEPRSPHLSKHGTCVIGSRMSP